MVKPNLAVLGHPVAHSLSPAMHNAAIESLGLSSQYHYIAMDVRPGDLATTLDSLRNSGFVGVNLTVPHKEAGYRWAMETFGPNGVSVTARLCKAVNTLVFSGDRPLVPWADNTDGTGLFNYLRIEQKADVAGKSVMVIGAGGTARSIIAVACEKARHIHVANRTPDKAYSLESEFKGGGATITSSGLDPQALASHVTEADLIVNTTSAGLQDTAIPDFPWNWVKRNCLVVDVMYGKETPFLREARHHGLKAVDGLGMLVYQGALAFPHWTGQKPDTSVMFRAAFTVLEVRKL